ncbi:MAG: permease-like cell division protein FtsX [Defluviitaleaceae bacterium]|nr:permease-like cell division protein FtsX [Defluviitaleaceae bacterium]
MKSKLGSGLRFRNVKYYLQEVFKSLVRNKIMSLTSVATVSASIIIVIATYAIATNVNFVLGYLENTVGLTVFLEDELDYIAVERMEAQIYGMSNVRTIDFVSSEEALVQFAAQFPENSQEMLLGLAEGEPLLARSFVVSLHDIRLQGELITTIESFHGVSNIEHAQALTDILIGINSFVALFNLLIILILLILSVVIITNTIKLTVNNRRNEIVIMKYVGATDWFIKWPFMIEGIVIGIIGAIIPLTVAWLGYDRVVAMVGNWRFVGDLPFYAAGDIFPLMSPMIILLGAAIGTFGSITSMRKHLNV